MKNIILLIILGLISCKQKNTSTTSIGDHVNNDKETKNNVDAIQLDPLPLEKLRYIFDNTTYLDYIFYDLPFSINQSEKPSIQKNVLMISPDSAHNISKYCKRIGREFFHINGDIEWEAEILFDTSVPCMAYIFYKDNKAIYANAMTDDGINFYSNMLKQNFELQ